MKFIIVDHQSGRSRAFSANRFLLGVTLAGLIGLPVAAAYFSYRMGLDEAAMIGEMVDKWQQVLKDQEESSRWRDGMRKKTWRLLRFVWRNCSLESFAWMLLESA